MSTPYYLSHKAKDIDSKLSEISNTLKVWKNNTPYNLGDVVISDYTDLNINTTFTALLTCREGHLSNDNGVPGLVDTDKWDIKQIVSEKAIRAVMDGLGNSISDTYATKSDLKSVSKYEILNYIDYKTKETIWIIKMSRNTYLFLNYVL